MAWNLRPIEQMQLRGRRRVDGAGNRNLISTQALANEKCETAVSLFAQRRLAAQANAAQFPALAARAQASDEILACAAEQLEIYNRVHDARLFGIRADGGVIFSLVSLAVTFYVFVFFWMFGIDAGR